VRFDTPVLGQQAVTTQREVQNAFKSLFADTDNAKDLKNLYVNRLLQHIFQPFDRLSPAFRFVPIVNAGPLVKKRYVHHFMSGWPPYKYVVPFLTDFRLRVWELVCDYFDTFPEVLRFEFVRIDDNRLTFLG
jgi:hypothetical protein